MPSEFNFEFGKPKTQLPLFNPETGSPFGPFNPGFSLPGTSELSIFTPNEKQPLPGTSEGSGPPSTGFGGSGSPFVFPPGFPLGGILPPNLGEGLFEGPPNLPFPPGVEESLVSAIQGLLSAEGLPGLLINSLSNVATEGLLGHEQRLINRRSEENAARNLFTSGIQEGEIFDIEKSISNELQKALVSIEVQNALLKLQQAGLGVEGALGLGSLGSEQNRLELAKLLGVSSLQLEELLGLGGLNLSALLGGGQLELANQQFGLEKLLAEFGINETLLNNFIGNSEQGGINLEELLSGGGGFNPNALNFSGIEF